MNCVDVELRIDEDRHRDISNKLQSESVLEYKKIIDGNVDVSTLSEKEQQNFRIYHQLINHFPLIPVLEKEGKTGEVLNIACGYGLSVKILETLGFKVIRIDINDDYIIEGKKGGLDVQVMNAMALQFPDQSFDITASSDFLVPTYWDGGGILKQRSNAAIRMGLENKARVLKEGGIVICYTMIWGNETTEKGKEGLYWAEQERLDHSLIKDLPFREHRRYKLIGEGIPEFNFVDVLEK